MKLLMLRGLPGSGKSTWARQFVSQNPGWVRVNKDSLRDMMAGYRPGKDEAVVLQMRDSIIQSLLDNWNSVVVDDTNFHPKHEKRLRELAHMHSAEFETKFFDTPLKACIKNDLKRLDSVGEKVIRKMWSDYLAPKKEVQNWTIGLPKAIIVDIDGTVALHVARGPYEMEKLDTDKPNRTIVAIVKGFYEAGHEIIFVSGREEKYRAATEEWFRRELHTKPGSYRLFMRPTDDRREDSIVKQEIYDSNIRGHYNVFAVLDDRNRCVELWRRLGLTCLQVADGDF